MNNNLTELIFILDMSGSMNDLRNDTIGGYNTLIDEQRKAEGEALVTTVLFDDRYIMLHDRVDIQKIPHLTEREYVPLGMTAMLDAVGKALVSAGEKLVKLPEEERPGKVMVTIITDGYENASSEYSWRNIKKMIKEQRKKYNWVFTFIGADIDNLKVSDELGIDPSLSKKYTKSSIGTASVYTALSKSASKLRSSAGMAPQAVIDSVAEELDKIE